LHWSSAFLLDPLLQRKPLQEKAAREALPPAQRLELGRVQVQVQVQVQAQAQVLLRGQLLESQALSQELV
jgi:hypothetical protein